MKKFLLGIVAAVMFVILSINSFAKDIKVEKQRTDGKKIVVTDEMTKFIKAIAIQESGDKPKKPKWDVNAVRCGHLQLSKDVVTDAIKYDPELSYITWEECATNREYSVKIFCAYMMRYCKSAVESYDFEKMARTWNGGPGYMKSQKGRDGTAEYWKSVKKIMNSLNDD